MELIAVNLHNPNPPIVNPAQNIRNCFELWINSIVKDPFDRMKRRCIPIYTSNPYAKKEIIYYSWIVFPKKDLVSPSFNDSPTFNNLIVDDDGILFKLVFQVTWVVRNLPPWQSLLKVEEYTIPWQPVLARKFISFE